jgi:hypothetical protein
LILGISISFLAISCVAQPSGNSESAPIKGKKVCVADVANSSLVPIATDALKSRFVDNLRKSQVNADNTYAVTILASQMTLTSDNRTVMHRQKCAFMLLSEVTKAKSASTDQSTPALALDFGLFKKDGTAVTKGSLPADSATNDALLATVDKASTQISQTVPKK